MGEIIPFPNTPSEPIPPHRPEPGEKPPENVIFPKEFQLKPAEEEDEKKTRPLPESGKELARDQVKRFVDIWSEILGHTSGKPKVTTEDGWDYHGLGPGWSMDISQTDPKEDREGVTVVRLREKEGAKQTLTSMRIGSSYYGDSTKLRRERVDIFQREQTGKILGASEPLETMVLVLYDEEGKILGARYDESGKGLEVARQLAQKVTEKLERGQHPHQP